MRVTALVPTHHLPEESMAWVTEARNIFDEVIVLIDQQHVTPGTLARAEKVATKVVRNNCGLWRDPNRFSLLSGSESDWVFILEYDEQLSSEWQQKEWKQILERTCFTHFWCARRWIVPSGRYLACEPWWPDFQIRLFRPAVRGTVFPSKLHDPIHVPGEGACLNHLSIHHHVLWLLSRAEREAKVRYYQQLRPESSLSYYYLHEDYGPAEADIPQQVKLAPAREIRQMQKLAPEQLANVSVALRSMPTSVRASQLFWVDAELRNDTEQELSACPPFGVRLAYHWIDRRTREMIVFDGHRSGLFPSAPARSATKYSMMIMAPEQRCKCILQTTLVQEHVRWFEDVRPEVVREFAVDVC